MTNFPSIKNLAAYIDAGLPILYIYTSEETAVDEAIRKAADKKEILEWNNSDGFVFFENKNPIEEDKSLEDTLVFLKKDKGEELKRKIFVIKDAASLLESDRIIALLKELSRIIRQGVDAAIIIVSSQLRIPHELEKQITVFELDRPDEEEISEIVTNFIEENGMPTVQEGLLNRITIAFKGLYESEIKDLLSLALAKDGDLSDDSIALINDQKQQMVLKSGILEMIPLKESMDDIGGLENLKEWLKTKAYVFANITEATRFGVPMPKGILIAGAAGCGKSLSAKAAGKLFDVPLLKLDIGCLMGKYFGESEENMRKAISIAEVMSPCVLWIDELEKAFAGINGSGGGSEATMRLFSLFLTWMQEKTYPVFVIATANNTEKLPLELKRKGVFDEIFYVDLPNSDERKRIFEIHLNKRRKDDTTNIDIEKLADKTEGFSGADIESVVGESVENAFVGKNTMLTTDDLLKSIESANSLSDFMGDSIKELMEYYEKNNFRKASRDEAVYEDEDEHEENS